LSAKETFEKYGVEINSHDFDRLLPLVSRDCKFWFSSGTYTGLDETRRAFERTWGMIQQEVYSVSDVDWIAESDGAAVCTYTFHWEGVINAERRQGRGRGTSCLRKEAGGWRIVHEHLSPFPT
jgi:ketosteroid isomerase-like protein